MPLINMSNESFFEGDVIQFPISGNIYRIKKVTGLKLHATLLNPRNKYEDVERELNKITLRTDFHLYSGNQYENVE